MEKEKEEVKQEIVNPKVESFYIIEGNVIERLLVIPCEVDVVENQELYPLLKPLYEEDEPSDDVIIHDTEDFMCSAKTIFAKDGVLNYPLKDKIVSGEIKKGDKVYVEAKPIRMSAEEQDFNEKYEFLYSRVFVYNGVKHHRSETIKILIIAGIVNDFVIGEHRFVNGVRDILPFRNN